MNREQTKSLIRTLVATFGGMISGYFAAKGWIDAGTVMGILNSETFISLAASIVVGAWGILEKTRAGLVTAAARVPEVKTIEVVDPRMAREINPRVPATVTATSR